MIDEIDRFIQKLATINVPPNVYNQYSDDHPESSVRRKNLGLYLQQMANVKPKIMLVGEAPGYRGSRLTGVPFTSEYLLMHNKEGLTLFGEENGYELPIEKEKLLKEATATIIWETMLKEELVFLSWNPFPFHPHRINEEKSNRMPTKKELMIGEVFLLDLVRLYQIEEIITMGNKAYESLTKLGIKCQKVRHPAQGGKKEFVAGVKQIKENLKQ